MKKSMLRRNIRMGEGKLCRVKAIMYCRAQVPG
jgi:hypothetical protein